MLVPFEQALHETQRMAAVLALPGGLAFGLDPLHSRFLRFACFFLPSFLCSTRIFFLALIFASLPLSSGVLLFTSSLFCRPVTLRFCYLPG
jgi:hypothetical protein